MKQLLQSMRSGAITVRDVPAPSEPKRAGVIVRVHASLISAGTEKMKVDLARSSMLEKARKRPDDVRKVLADIRQQGFWSTYERVMRKLDTPGPLGYSCAGEVIAVSNDVDDLKPGDRVACGGQGAYHSEVVSVLRNLCVKLPDNVPYTDGCYTTLGAIAMQGLRQAELTFGETVVVIGLGLVGQLACSIARAAGCVAIGIDLDDEHVHTAREHTAHYAFNRRDDGLEQSILALTHGHGADAILIAAATSSNDPIELSAKIARDRGRIVMVGVTKMDIPRDPFYMKELEFKLSRSYGPGRYEHSFEDLGIDYPIGYVRWTERRNMQEFVRLMSDGLIRPSAITTHTFAIDKAEEAYALIAGEKKERYLGIVLTYPEVSEARAHSKPTANPANTITRAGAPVVGFIGAGNFAQGFLLPELKQLARLKTVANQTGASAVDAQSKFGFEASSSNADDVLNDPDINTVFIATRHGSHAELVQRALANGKHVFVEKPLALDEASLGRLMQQYESSGQQYGSKLMVGFNRRFAELVVRTKKFFTEAATPKLIFYRVNAGPLPGSHWTQDPQEGGGRIIGEVCHFIDTISYLCDDALPVSISAHAIEADRSDIVNHDSVSITIAYANGSVATILYIANGDKLLPKEEIQVFSAGKTAIMKNFTELELWRGKGKPEIIKGSGKGHKEEVRAFIDSIAKGTPSPIPMDSLFATTLATFAMVQSLSTGETIRFQ